MLDFLVVSTKTERNGTLKIYPKFRVYPPSKDLMVRGGDFYAVFDEYTGQWTKSEDEALRLIDFHLEKFREENKNVLGEHAQVQYMWDADTGMIDKWHHFVSKQVRDNFIPLDETLIFQNTEKRKENYSTKSLNYALKKGECAAWNRILEVLYTKEERHKIEWCIGSIVSGDSKWIQKFLVFYGSAGTGKSTIINIIRLLFDGYTCAFVASDLANAGSAFALEPFKNNPLVAIEHDGDLSKIETNTRLNSLISHEEMIVNEKHKSQYVNTFKAFLVMGTNKPVKITDARSGIIRRLIDVAPSGNTLDSDEYFKLMNDVKYELGAIAYKCLKIYEDNPKAYNNYIPLNMLDSTNDFYNFMSDNYKVFDQEDGVSLKSAWSMYQTWVEDSKIPYPMSKRIFKEELKNYFDNFDERIGGNYNYFSGFKRSRFESRVTIPDEIKNVETWIKLEEQESIFDEECKECPAQPAGIDGFPVRKWDNNNTILSDLSSKALHYVKVPLNHIVIDFDIPDENGEKNLELNLKEASKWPPTYCELSKSGKGVHLHYIYDGDPTKLSSIFNEKIEIKVFTGNQSLRRKLTLCNNIPINSISSGLPVKKEKPMIDENFVTDEKKLRSLIMKCLRKEVHSSTKCNVDFIKKLLDDAYASGMKYDVTDLKQDSIAFANGSTNQASLCFKLLRDAHWKSDEIPESINVKLEDGTEPPLCWYDIEIFPNLFVVCYKVEGTENVVTLINPSRSDIDFLMKFRLIGFNNRKYDNHMIYGCWMGMSVEELYVLSQDIIIHNTGFFGQAYNLSYTDIYDYMANKMSLKKLEIKMGIRHLELGLPWDKPVPEHLWGKVAEYCCNDVTATEAAWYFTSADFTARRILADLAEMTANDTTNSLTTRFIFGSNKHPQNEFYWRNLAEPVYEEDMDPESIALLKEWFPEMMAEPHGEKKSLLPYFEGYKFEFGKSTYMGEDVGEGGFAEGFPGYYVNTALLDVASMHPHSAMTEMIFGPRFTKAYHQIVYGRVHIKHKAWDIVDGYLDGKLRPYIEQCKAGTMSHKDLANALKIAINSVYGLTSAKFENPFKDPRNDDNIVAKRGALFMIALKHTLLDMGYTVAHIKTDSIKIPNATPEVINFVMTFGKRYGYTFEHEATYEKMVLVNDAVYISKYATTKNCEAMYGYAPGDNIEHEAEGKMWTATGTQFKIPFVFKKLFSKEPIEFEDMTQTIAVSGGGDLYMDKDEDLDIQARTMMEADAKRAKDKIKRLMKKNPYDPEIKTLEYRVDELERSAALLHNLVFVGRVGSFVPIKSGNNAGTLYRVANGKLSAAAGTTGYRFLESATVIAEKLEDQIDLTYWMSLVDTAREEINKYVDYDYFVNADIPPIMIDTCGGNCNICGYLRRQKAGVYCACPNDNKDIQELSYATLHEYCKNNELEPIPF